MTSHALCSAKLAMTIATKMSGQPCPALNTPKAANNTAKLPMTSLREHSHTDRMLLSPALYAHNRAKDAALAKSAATPTPPIVAASGTGSIGHMPERCGQHPQAEKPHRHAFGKRRAGPVTECHTDRKEADSVIGGIRLQRC